MPKEIIPTPALLSEVKRRYESGESSSEIALALGCPKPRIVTFLHRYGVKLRARRYTDQTFLLQFHRRIDKRGEDECWPWTAGKQDGYGSVRFRGKAMLASRVAWILEHGEIPKGLYVCHKCDNPPCCNPRHLFLGTHLENQLDRHRKGRTLRGDTHPSSKLTTKDVCEIRRTRGSAMGRDIARHFGVSETTISEVIHRKVWKHV